MIKLMGREDIGPREFAKIKYIESVIQSCFKSFGFQEISLPMLESSDLFLKRLGDRIKSQIYIFKDNEGNEIALRPELTSPVIRYFLEHYKYENYPLKFCYSGKVFRCQTANEDIYREFTHIGTEIIGVESVLNDAESIVLACKAAEKLGITNYKLTLGNVGILTNLVNHLDVDVAFKSFFIENLKVKEGKDILNQAMEKGFFKFDANVDYKDLMNILKKLSPDEEKILLSKLLNIVHPHFSESLDEADDVVEGILAKIKRQNNYDSIHYIMDFSEKLKRICGKPSDTIETAKSLLRDSNIDISYVIDLEKVTNFLIEYGINEDNIVIDFGLGRNLQYYTGIIFEIDYIGKSDNTQICGGGRYDDLIEILGYNKPLSGCGFTFYLEKICNLLLEEDSKVHQFLNDKIDLYFIVFNDKNTKEIFPIIQEIRKRGFNVYTDISDIRLDNKLNNIKKQNVSLIAIFGDNNDKVKLINSKTHKEEFLSPDEFLGRFLSKG
ncbi:MAG: histidine--tRNA ligase family protein [Spirochaetota bacterium]|nr:histidine--tRNA ligase family protein [Spirochaetota bacterium]